MSWSTVYISGSTDFRQEVKRKLEHSSFPHMPGFVESQAGQGPSDLYWLDSATSLRRFKETIGGKLIWKHRMRFYRSLEEFTNSQLSKDNAFTRRENEMISEMRAAS